MAPNVMGGMNRVEYDNWLKLCETMRVAPDAPVPLHLPYQPLAEPATEHQLAEMDWFAINRDFSA